MKAFVESHLTIILTCYNIMLVGFLQLLFATAKNIVDIVIPSTTNTQHIAKNVKVGFQSQIWKSLYTKSKNILSVLYFCLYWYILYCLLSVRFSGLLFHIFSFLPLYSFYIAVHYFMCPLLFCYHFHSYWLYLLVCKCYHICWSDFPSFKNRKIKNNGFISVPL